MHNEWMAQRSALARLFFGNVNITCSVFLKLPIDIPGLNVIFLSCRNILQQRGGGRYPINQSGEQVAPGSAGGVGLPGGGRQKVDGEISSPGSGSVEMPSRLILRSRLNLKACRKRWISVHVHRPLSLPPSPKYCLPIRYQVRPIRSLSFINRMSGAAFARHYCEEAISRECGIDRCRE